MNIRAIIFYKKTSGQVRNFLDADKIAALFWGYIAVIVALDVQYAGKEVVETTV